MQHLSRDEVSLLIQAPPERIYGLVADVTRTPEFSPAIARCTWLDGAKGPAVGARFEAVNRTETGKTWKNRPVVTAAVPGREFAFSRTEPFAGTLLWRYRFLAEDGGTRVVESYDVTRPVSRLGWFIIERIFKVGDVPAGLRAGMQTTLERLRATAEHDFASRTTGAGARPAAESEESP
jgi:Polyketide cyclase / dehydrase and lipid transport